ncbi:hypothetical protein D3C71_1467030 [compost metagenome]
MDVARDLHGDIRAGVVDVAAVVVADQAAHAPSLRLQRGSGNAHVFDQPAVATSNQAADRTSTRAQVGHAYPHCVHVGDGS